MERHVNRAFLALVLAGLLAVPLGTALWGRKDTAAYYENRALAAWEPPTGERLWDGGFGAAFETWFSDHAPGRATLLKLDTKVQMDLLRRPVVHETIVTEAELLPFLDYAEQPAAAFQETAAAQAEKIAKLDAHIRENGGAFYYAGFPEQRVYFQDRYPSYLSGHQRENEAADAAFARALSARGVRFLDMGAVYEGLGHPPELYSTVDHHYNYYGAYAAYRAILDTLTADGWDLPVLTEADIDLAEQPNPYIGSRNRRLYNLWPNAERAVIGVQREPVPFTRHDDGARSDRPLFVLPEDPAMPTTYSLYMGGDFGETVLETHRPELPDALIFGDSFTNALETLLYASFDETRILDLRHYREKSLKDYIAEHQPDIVLCVQNDTFYYTTSGNGDVWPEE